jgi:hypothetical protein
MTISQRGASFSGLTDGYNATYTLDRWQWCETATSTGVQTISQDTSVPTGFVNSLKILTTTAHSVGTGNWYNIRQWIEGLNTYDLAWGTAYASPVTLSFWVKSSLTGTFAGNIQNVNFDRSYVFTYTINSSNTWEYKTVTIPGCTTGTWNTDNSRGISISFDLGTGSDYRTTSGSWQNSNYGSVTGAVSVIGTLNATFQITGVQFEKGSAASAFEYRQYGTELQLCQRYYWKNSPESAYGWIAIGRYQSGYVSLFVPNPVTMRAAPTFIVSNLGSTNGTPTGALTGTYGGTQTSLLQATFTGQSETVGYVESLQQNGTPSSGYLSASAEL